MKERDIDEELAGQYIIKQTNARCGMTDEKLLNDAISHIRALIAALDHAEQFGAESATGCRSRAKTKVEAFNFMRKHSSAIGRNISQQDPFYGIGTMYDPPLQKRLSKPGESPCCEITTGQTGLCNLHIDEELTGQ